MFYLTTHSTHSIRSSDLSFFTLMVPTSPLITLAMAKGDVAANFLSGSDHSRTTNLGQLSIYWMLFSPSFWSCFIVR